jgi:hypothetical protein
VTADTLAPTNFFTKERLSNKILIGGACSVTVLLLVVKQFRSALSSLGLLATGDSTAKPTQKWRLVPGMPLVVVVVFTDPFE